MLENHNDEVATMEERVIHTREERDRLQLRHHEAGLSLVTTKQELAEARSATIRALEVDALKERQVAALREEQLQKDRETEAIRRQLFQRGHGTRSSLEISSANGGPAAIHVATHDHPGLLYEQCT